MPPRHEYSVDLRQLVVRLRVDGLSYGKIATTVKLPRSSVQYIVEKYHVNGTISNAPRSGRPRLTDARIDRIIVREVAPNCRLSAKTLTDALKVFHDTQVSRKTVLRRNRRPDRMDALHARSRTSSRSTRKAVQMLTCTNWSPPSFGNVWCLRTRALSI